MTRRRTDGCSAAISASGIHNPTAAKNASWKSASTLRFSQIHSSAALRMRDVRYDGISVTRALGASPR